MAELLDGYQTLFSFQLDPTVVLLEKESTPPGFDGGGPIDITTMRNRFFRTKAPKTLIDLSEAKVTGAYFTEAYNIFFDMINVNQIIVTTLPDATTIAYWAFIDTFKPNPHKEGEQPTAEVRIIPTLIDDQGVETAPVITVINP